MLLAARSPLAFQGCVDGFFLPSALLSSCFKITLQLISLFAESIKRDTHKFLTCRFTLAEQALQQLYLAYEQSSFEPLFESLFESLFCCASFNGGYVRHFALRGDSCEGASEGVGGELHLIPRKVGFFPPSGGLGISEGWGGGIAAVSTNGRGR